MLTALLMACTTSQTFDHGGLERKYLLHLPEDLPEQAPLVFFLHGYGGNARPYSWLGMKGAADEQGFAVVFPQGSDDQEGASHWNAQLDISNTDDIDFLSALAANLQDTHDLDPLRTYSSGISNGGFMSYALVCQAPEVFHAAGSIIGTMSGETWQTCPSRSVPIFQLSGTEDDIVPIDGSMDPEGGWGGAPDMDTIIDHWPPQTAVAKPSPLTLTTKTPLVPVTPAARTRCCTLRSPAWAMTCPAGAGRASCPASSCRCSHEPARPRTVQGWMHFGKKSPLSSAAQVSRSQQAPTGCRSGCRGKTMSTTPPSGAFCSESPAPWSAPCCPLSSQCCCSTR